MSGIYGAFTDQSLKKNNERNMRALLLWNRAYGRIAEDLFDSKACFLGCCFEHFSDSIPKSKKILSREHKYAAIDALLYNRDELIAAGEYSSDLSDEELLFKYILKFGYKALKNVNGDFAGTIYDEADNSVTIFRDHMGIRPLFYYDKDDILYFSSDIRGIISIDSIDASVSKEWIYKTLTGHPTMTDRVTTEYEHIFCVEPASYYKFYFDVNSLKCKKTSYWELGKHKIRLSSDQEYQTRLRELITDSVKRRLDAISGLVGAELSGGLDSGVIDILINRLGRDCVYSSWSYSPDVLEIAENDERLIIDDICKQEGITCNYKKTDFSLDSNIARNMRSSGLTIPDNNSILYAYVLPTYLNTLPICNTAQFIQRSGASVVFTGHGGDEGVSHRCNPYEMFYQHEYINYLHYMYSSTCSEKHRIRETVKACKENLSKTRKKLRSPFSNGLSDDSSLINQRFADRYKNKKLPSLQFAFDPIGYIKQGGSRNRLDNIALYGAYNQVRYLVPYLDYRVIDFAVSIPRYQYLRGFRNRYIFREAFKDILPESLYQLRAKETNSHKSIKPDPKRFDIFIEEKKEVIKSLNRAYWEEYIDFDKLDKWVQKGKPSEEELPLEKELLYALSSCNLAEKIVDLSRKAVKE